MDFAIGAITDSLRLVVPEIVLVGTACLFFLLAGFFTSRALYSVLALLAFLVAMAVWGGVGHVAGYLGTASPLREVSLTWIFRGINLLVGSLLALAGMRQAGKGNTAEYLGCLLLIVAGIGLVAVANDLVMLFLALELVSIPTYVLLYLSRHSRATQEAAIKYFLLSIFSSALVLQGMSLLYGLAGSTNLEVIRTAVGDASPSRMPLLLGLSVVLLVAGLGFRITAVPFHFYAPDVYQGAPTVAAGLLAVAPKLAGFAALFQVLSATLLIPGPYVQADAVSNQMMVLFWILAAVSMCLGNFLGLLQDNLKRLLAYSSIAHAGYMLVGLGAGYPHGAAINGIAALYFYLAVYSIMTLGVFTILGILEREERPVETVDDLAGLGSSHPGLALMMAVFLFSLTGLPPTAGFYAKLWLLAAAWYEGSLLFQTLAVILSVNAAIGGWYYLRLVAAMYLRQPVKPLPPVEDRTGLACSVLCALAMVGLFVAPGYLWQPLDKASLESGFAVAAESLRPSKDVLPETEAVPGGYRGPGTEK